jgi:NhaP-type Na+/H+ or K+/H+ antiporter
VWVVASLVICASIVLHGLTSTRLTLLYGRYRADEDEALMAQPIESLEVRHGGGELA